MKRGERKINFNFMIPTNRELKAAQKWWRELPEEIKGRQSIWVILAMYAEHVLSLGRRAGDPRDPEVKVSPKVPPEL